jgi:hypothetical protein
MSVAMELAVVAALLRQGALLHGLSRLALLVALLAGLVFVARRQVAWLPALLCAASVLGGFAQTFFAVRVGLDAALFERLARLADVGGAELAAATVALDTALQRQFALPESSRGRDWAQRIAGARRLFRLQQLALALQWLALLAALMVFAVQRHA